MKSYLKGLFKKKENKLWREQNKLQENKQQLEPKHQGSKLEARQQENLPLSKEESRSPIVTSQEQLPSEKLENFKNS